LPLCHFLLQQNGRFPVRKFMMTDENDIVIEQIAEDETPTPTKPMQPVGEPAPIIEERTAVSPPPPVPPPASPPASPPTAVSQRRGCVLLIFGAILGAILGTVLTLSILMGLNGSLTFTSTDAQLRRAINEASIEQENTANMLATRSAHIDYMATKVDGVVLDLQAAHEAVSTAEAGVNEVQMAVTAVATEVNRLDKRLETTEGQIENVAESAAKFDTFLTGLKALLLDETSITATPEVKEATPINKTPAAESATPTQTATGEAVRTVRPTRTPQPTRTPLPVLTNTPEQRP
jgi:hypothetical protein